MPVPDRNFTVKQVALTQNELLDGRTALITGGTSGIGFHIAEAFLNAGATVVITSRKDENLRKACKALNPKGLYDNRILGAVMNNAKVETFQECFDGILDQVKSRGESNCIDILVNNAGILGGNMPNAIESDFNSVIETNLSSVFFLSQIIGKHFKDNKIEGNILNIASSSSLRPATSAYALSKWGVRGLTLGLAKSLAPHGITVNGIAPGPTATPMLLDKNLDNINNRANPIGRYALPEEIANMAMILVSPIGRTVVGDIVYMTGGAGVITFDDIDHSF